MQRRVMGVVRHDGWMVRLALIAWEEASMVCIVRLSVKPAWLPSDSGLVGNGPR